jgi:hypothetical protein
MKTKYKEEFYQLKEFYLKNPISFYSHQPGFYSQWISCAIIFFQSDSFKISDFCNDVILSWTEIQFGSFNTKRLEIKNPHPQFLENKLDFTLFDQQLFEQLPGNPRK